jgi:hypothetical protein
MGVSHRIKIKSVAHYTRCVASLKEHDIQFPSADMDELSLRRSKSKSAWLYIGSNNVGWLFFSFQPVRYAKSIKRKELIKWLRKQIST